jgi:hypothetical protein
MRTNKEKRKEGDNDEDDREDEEVLHVWRYLAAQLPANGDE